ncbi:MAG: hypothetical protein AWU54_1948, partial [Candidatus Frackibacter sp. T328-2]
MASRTTYQTHFLLGAKVQSSMNKSFAKVQKNMKNIRKGAGYTESAFSKLGRTVKNAFAAAGIYFGARAIVRSFQSVTTSAMNLNDKMADVATLLDGDAKKKIGNYKEEVQELAIAVGKSSDELSTGLYKTISALGESPESMKIFTKIAENAVAGNVKVADSVAFVTGTMKAYGEEGLAAAEKISDLGFQAVKHGDTTFPELAKNMGKVAPIASSLGVGMEPLFGAMATLTGVTGNTAEVATGVRGIMKAFIKPSSDMQKVITGLGYSSGEAMIKARGFKGSLEILNKITGGSTQEMGKLFRETEALTNVLALTGDQADAFTRKTKAMTDAENASKKAFETKISTTKALWNRFKQLGNTIKEDFGNVTLPGLNSALTNVLSNSEGIRNKFKAVAGQLGRVFEVGAAAFNSVKEAIDDNSLRILFLKMRLNVVKKSFVNAFQAGKPALNWMINTGIPAAVDVMISLSNKALDVYNFFNDNWTAIEPIVFGITSALVAYKTAQLGVIAGLIAPLGFEYFAIYVLTIFVVYVLAGTILNKVLPGKSTDLLIDIPPLRMPRLSNVLQKTYMKSKSFIKEAGPIFAIGALIITVMQETGMLPAIQNSLIPLTVGWLQLPKETATVFIMGIIRRDFGAAGLTAIAL